MSRCSQNITCIIVVTDCGGIVNGLTSEEFIASATLINDNCLVVQEGMVEPYTIPFNCSFWCFSARNETVSLTVQLKYAYHVTSFVVLESGDELTTDQYMFYHGTSTSSWTQFSAGVWNVTVRTFNKLFISICFK